MGLPCLSPLCDGSRPSLSFLQAWQVCGGDAVCLDMEGAPWRLLPVVVQVDAAFSETFLFATQCFPSHSSLFLCVYFMMFGIKWEEGLSKAMSQAALYGHGGKGRTAGNSLTWLQASPDHSFPSNRARNTLGIYYMFARNMVENISLQEAEVVTWGD